MGTYVEMLWAAASPRRETLRRQNNHTPQPLAADGTLELYPVPADQVLNVVLNSSVDQQAEIHFFDLLGRPISRNLIAGLSPTLIDVHAWPRGMLLYRCMTESGEVFAGKIMLK